MENVYAICKNKLKLWFDCFYLIYCKNIVQVTLTMTQMMSQGYIHHECDLCCMLFCCWWLLFADRHPPSAVRCFAVHYSRSAVRCFAVHYSLSAVRCFAVHYSLSAVRCPPSAVHCPSPAARRPLSAVQCRFRCRWGVFASILTLTVR